MKGSFQSVYLRSNFTLPLDAKDPQLGLAISYDDAFIAYINGHEVLRKGVGKGRGKKASNVGLHEANGKFDFFPLKEISEFLKPGKNIIAIEGHNAEINSSDFSLHPILLLTKG